MKHLIAYLQTIDKRWLTTWTLIYVGFVILGSFFPDFIGTSILKIVSIALCVVYACQKFKKDSLLIIALAFTLLADVILTINDVSIAGVVTFCFAQFFHTARLKQTKPIFLVFYGLTATIIFMIAVWLEIDPMYAIASIYGYGLFSNLFFAVRWYFAEKSTASTCAAMGFLLFVFCDLCVAMSYLGVTGVLPFIFKPVGDYFAWIFYYPSQILISNSSATGTPNAKKTLKKLATDS